MQQVDEQKAREVMAVLQLYQQQAEALVNQISLYEMTMEQYHASIATLEEIKSMEGSPEQLFAIGAECFLEGEIKNTEKVLISIGSGFTVEKTIEEGLSILQSRQENMKKTVQDMGNRLQTVNSEINNIQALMR